MSDNRCPQFTTAVGAKTSKDVQVDVLPGPRSRGDLRISSLLVSPFQAHGAGITRAENLCTCICVYICIDIL